MANKWNSSKLSEFVDAKTGIVPFRIIMPFLLIYNHGWPKLMMVINGNFDWMNPIGIGATASLILATFAEAICAFLVLIGFYTRGASLILLIHFAIAVIFVHLGQPFGNLELPLLYWFTFLTTFLLGAGKFSIDDMSGGSRY